MKIIYLRNISKFYLTIEVERNSMRDEMLMVWKDIITISGYISAPNSISEYCLNNHLLLISFIKF